MLGAAITAVGSGLIYTFDIGSPAKVWIGYQVSKFWTIVRLSIDLACFQILGGLGVGFSFQVPIMVTQATTRDKDVPLATAILLCKCSNGWLVWKELCSLLIWSQLFKPLEAPSVSQLRRPPFKIRY